MAEPMDEDRLKALLANYIRGALGYDADALSSERSDNLARFEGEAYGDERSGRSQVMSRDVMETIEAVMPSLVRTFLGTDEVVTFQPVEQSDEAYSAQATDYVNHVLMRDNPGFRIGVDWMKSALISSTSVVKIWWDETDKTTTEHYTDLSDDQLIALSEDEGVEVLEHTPYTTVDGVRLEDDQAAMLAQMGAPVVASHDVKIRKTTTKKRLRWEAVPPEEFLINRRARTLDEDDNTFAFCAHRQARTIEELENEGYDPEVLARAPEHDDWFLNEAEERWDDLEYSDENYVDSDYSQRRVWVYECYLKVDYDGDGIGELRKITVIGGATSTEILDNEEVYELPFAELCPIRLPYRFYGWSLADLTKDIQRLKTAIWRAMMDGLYLSIYPHRAVNKQIVDLDDLLSEAPGSIFGVDGDPNGAIVPMANAWPGAQAFSMMEYIDRVLKSRSGVNDLAGGLDGGALSSETARGVEEAANSARARVELIARTFAETGWTRLVRLALRMLNRHQDKARTIRLRNEWVPIDPRSWNTEMDVKINVGLGVGTKQEQIAKLAGIAAKQEQILMQMGPNNPIAPLNKYYATLKAMVEATDREPDQFFTDPTQWMEQQAQQPPQPNPEAMKAQAEMQMRQQESQAKLQQYQQEAQAKLQQAQAEAMMRAETDRMKATQDAENARMKAESESATARFKAELDAAVQRERAAAQIQIDRERIAMEHQYRMAELGAEQQLEREKMAAGSRDGQGNLNLSER
jgi:hypothetical protein